MTSIFIVHHRDALHPFCQSNVDKFALFFISDIKKHIQCIVVVDDDDGDVVVFLLSWLYYI